MSFLPEFLCRLRLAPLASATASGQILFPVEFKTLRNIRIYFTAALGRGEQQALGTRETGRRSKEQGRMEAWQRVERWRPGNRSLVFHYCYTGRLRQTTADRCKLLKRTAYRGSYSEKRSENGERPFIFVDIFRARVCFAMNRRCLGEYIFRRNCCT